MDQEEANILIIDDDYDVLKSAHVFLKRFYTKVEIEQVPENIMKRIAADAFDVVLLDMNFQKGSRDGEEGFYWLNHILNQSPDLVVILITAYGDVDLAIRAIKEGAIDFVLKPWKNQKLLATINAALKLKKSKNEVEHLRQTQQKLVEDQHQHYGPFIGDSEKITECKQMIEKVAATDADILILGENGTGKELIARYIHKLSERNRHVFIPVDLGALSETLFESELFGHVKGAFTDALEDKPGRFEMAQNGTIFLDEIGNLSLPLQSKLLTVLQNRKTTRVGSVREIPVNFRLICATNQSLYKMAEQGTFRQDLLYRINMVEVHVPPLRERQDDIALLFDHFFNIYRKKYHKPALKYSPKTIEKLGKYAWPGNVRELQHAVERAVILSDRNLMTYADIMPFSPAGGSVPSRDITSLDEMEKQHIIKIIEKNRGNITKAAEELGISRTALHRRINKYGL
jgi:DNA-binding NtrC family response regulator